VPKIGSKSWRVPARHRRGSVTGDYAALGAAMVLGLLLVGSVIENALEHGLGAVGPGLVERAATPPTPSRPSAIAGAPGAAVPPPATAPGLGAGPGPITAPLAPLPGETRSDGGAPADPRGGEVASGGTKDAADPRGACLGRGETAGPCKDG